MASSVVVAEEGAPTGQTESTALLAGGRQSTANYHTAAEADPEDGTPVLQKFTRGPMLRLLYFSSFLSAWGNRMWEFAVPILLTSVFTDSLLPASAFSFFTQLSCVLFGTMMGQMVDDSDRKKVITYSLIVQNTCVSICAVIVWFIIPFGAPHPPLQNWLFDLIFLALVTIGSIASLASMVGDIAVGRDWVVVITKGHNEELTQANAMVTRISLFCKVAAPVLFSLVMAFTSTTVCLIFVGLWNIVSIVPEMGALLRIYKEVEELQMKIAVKPRGNAFQSLWRGWAMYINAERIFLASFAYTLLYWTALSPGALMSAYLLTRGINEVYIALYNAASSVMGIVSTFITPSLLKKFGIEKTGLYFIWGQDACLLLCVVFFFVPNAIHISQLASSGMLDVDSFLNGLLAQYSTPYNWSIWAFLLALIVSRTGLWTFDLAERQIMQEYVPEDSRGVINSVEYSLTNLFSLASYGMGMIFFAPEQFGILVVISFGVVTLAALLYWRWYCAHSNSNNREKNI